MKAKRVRLKDRFEVCDVCGYEGGFHVIFERSDAAGPGRVKFRLKCPNCGQIYDLDLFCTMLEKGK